MIKEAAVKGHKEQIKKCREWGANELADEMEKMKIKVIKL